MLIICYNKVSTNKKNKEVYLYMTVKNQPIRILQATVSNDKGELTGYICQIYRYMDKKTSPIRFFNLRNRIGLSC